MSVPTEKEMVAAFEREFPSCRISDAERAFLAFVHISRRHGLGYGWMRQAIGLAWKLDDPRGYIDDERLVALSNLPPEHEVDTHETTQRNKKE